MTTSMIHPTSRLGVIFAARLRGRLANDPGFAAHLRHEAGTPLRQSRILVEWYGFLDRLPPALHDGASAEAAFLVATLCAHDRRFYRSRGAVAELRDGGDSDESSDRHPGGINFGGTLASLVRVKRPEDDAMARRLAILLDSSLDADGGGTLPWRLRRTVHLVLSRRAHTHIDWAQLLNDLLRWNAPWRPVQRDWARAYYRLALTSSNEPSDPAIAETF